MMINKPEITITRAEYKFYIKLYELVKELASHKDVNYQCESGLGDVYCALCGNDSIEGHKPDCIWLQAWELVGDVSEAGE